MTPLPYPGAASSQTLIGKRGGPCVSRVVKFGAAADLSGPHLFTRCRNPQRSRGTTICLMSFPAAD
jgi:hypothetical protein